MLQSNQLIWVEFNCSKRRTIHATFALGQSPVYAETQFILVDQGCLPFVEKKPVEMTIEIN